MNLDFAIDPVAPFFNWGAGGLSSESGLGDASQLGKDTHTKDLWQINELPLNPGENTKIQAKGKQSPPRNQAYHFLFSWQLPEYLLLWGA